jgi:hypothetical protein
MPWTREEEEEGELEEEELLLLLHGGSGVCGAYRTIWENIQPVAIA